MPVRDFQGNTFVAFVDISGFKELMKNTDKALDALKDFYSIGYNAVLEVNEIEGFFISDCGILFARSGSNKEKLIMLLKVIKTINEKMLINDYMLTSSIAYGYFDYQGKLEFDGIEKNPIYGNAYVQAYLDNEVTLPKIQPGQCRIVYNNMPNDINLDDTEFRLIKRKNKHFYYFWNLSSISEISNFEEQYSNSYNLKYSGMLKALKRN